MFESFLQNLLPQINSMLIYLNEQLTLPVCMRIASGLLAFLILLQFIKPKKNTRDKLISIDAIAGDDVALTQLDLARAYIEMGEKKLAKENLKAVLQCGNKIQKQDAKKLLKSIA